jgi:glycosyltransferase involved in cell wall biosynthesis/adenylate kinase family enzyme
MPKVSVLIPAYQAEDTIAKAIESVIAQTFQDFELIIVDDASTDNTYDIALNYKLTYDHLPITVIRNDHNLGMAANWNRCLQAANGDFVIKLDADDVFMPNILDEEVSYLEKHPDLVWVCADPAYINQFDEPIDFELGEIPTWFGGERTIDGMELLERIIRRGNFICSSSVMFRRSIIEDAGPFNPRVIHTADMEMWLRLACFAKVGRIPKPLLYYRVSDTSLTSQVLRNYKGSYYTTFALLQTVTYYWKQDKFSIESYLEHIYNLVELMADTYIKMVQQLKEGIEDLNRDIALKDAQAIDVQQQHKEHTQKFEAWIKERDEHIEELRADIVHKQADIGTLHSWVVERDEIIRKNEQDIELFKQWIAERDAGIIAIYDRLPMAQGQFDLVEQQLISLQEQLRATEEQLQHAERDVQTLHGWVADRDAQILHMHEVAAGYNARAMQLEAELNSIYGSMLGRLSQKVWRARQAVLPSNGFLLRNTRRARNAFGILRRGGPRSLAQHSLGWARYKLKRGKQAEKSAPAIVQLDTPAALSVAESNYLQWIALNEPNEQELQKQRLESHLLVYQPLLSIVTPVYNPPPALLEAMIDSVIAQSYGNWELVLVNGSPENPAVQAVIDKARARDRRIAIVNLAANQGIVGNTNAGLAEAHGEFIVFVDHDDTIAPFALYEVAKLLNQDPATDMLYSDSDLLSYDGTKRFQPLFKPDWSPAIMLSANYATHLCVIRTSVVEQLGGLAAGSDGAQDWDLILRVSEQTSRIRHLPKILYHWRESPTSTAIDISQKPYALQAQFGVIQRHLARKGIQAEVSLDKTGYIRAIWPVQANPLVSIIIPSRKLSLLQRCIQTIQQHTNYKRYELIVVDTTPQGEIAHFYAKSTVQVVHYTEPFNYSAVNNRAAKLAKGEVLLFLNDDTEAFEPDWLEEMLRWVQREEVGVVGAKLLRENGLLQHAGVVIGLSGFADHPFANGPEGQHTIYGCTEWYRNFSAVTGACLMIRRALFEQVGGFDELLVLCGNDVELCLRVGKLGYQVIYTPFARLLHLESVTRGSSSIPPADFTGSYLHYYPLLEQGDPFYNPNLSHWSLLPQVRQPEEEASLAFTQRFLVQNGLSVPTIVSTEAE